MTSYNSTYGYPGPVFYPSCTVNFQVRFDEGLTMTFDPKTPADLAGGSVTPSVEAPATGPVLLAKGTDNLSQITGITPRAATIELPSYRQAGTFSIEIPWRDFPIDPRVVRAIALTVHLGTVTADDFIDGMTKIPNGRRKSQLKPAEDNLLLAGTVDEIETSYDDKGAWVKMVGRDLRGVLLDTAVAAETFKSIDLTKPLDVVVSTIVNKLHPQGEGIKVVVAADDWPGGVVPSPRSLTDVTRNQLDAFGQKVRAGIAGEADKLNFWDLVTEYCFIVGAVPYFVGSELRLRPARSLYDQRRNDNPDSSSTFPTPFAQGQKRTVKTPLVKTSESYGYRRMVFGRNIKELTFGRKLAGVKVPVIECVSIDTSARERGKICLISEQYPPLAAKKERTTKVTAGGQAASTDVIRINVPGVKNKERLLEIAKDLHQEIGRQEMGGAVTTKVLTSFGGNNEDADLLRLRPGDPVEIRYDATGLSALPPAISELTNLASYSFEEAVAKVAEIVGNQNLARVLVSTARGQIAQLQQTFRVATTRFTWSADHGVQIDFDFQNYLEARYEAVE